MINDLTIAVAPVPYTYRVIIKGGPGSGNHGHAGIPGHQGGSQPQAIDKLAGDNEPAQSLDYLLLFYLKQW